MTIRVAPLAPIAAHARQHPRYGNSLTSEREYATIGSGRVCLLSQTPLAFGALSAGECERAVSVAKRYNEGKALDAVLRFIEARDHTPRENDGRSPDELSDPDEQRRVSMFAPSAKPSTPSSTQASSPSPTELG